MTLFLKRFYFLLIFLSLFLLIFLIFKYYYLWKNNSISKFLLPPYKSIFYLINYVLIHQAQSYLISLGLSLIVLGSLIFLNLKFNERFFYQEEPYFIAIFIFILGYPYCFYYLILTLFFGFLLNLIIFFKIKKNQRFSFYYLWIIFGILIFVFKIFLVII